MRFLIFNIAVAAALFYLLTGVDGIRDADLPRQMVATVSDVADAARRKVEDIVEAGRETTPEATAEPRAKSEPEPVPTSKPEPETAVAKTAPVPKPEPEAAADGSEAVATEPSGFTPPPSKPEPETAVAKTAPVPKPEPEAAPGGSEAAATEPSGFTPPPPPDPKFVTSRPVREAPVPGTTTSPDVAPPTDPAVAQRRAEVLGTNKAQSRFSVAEGATLMSPDERHQALSRLVDDLEVLYVDSLGN